METDDKAIAYLKRTAAELRQARQRLSEIEASRIEPIAVVGMGLRLPGGLSDPDALWEALVSGTDLIGDFPADRGWDVDGLYDPDPHAAGKSYTRRGGFLSDAAEFDAGFFGISPREALAMDPQQRLLLETSWEALEHAGIDPASLRGKPAGVYTGLITHDYATLGTAADGVEGLRAAGSAGSVAAGRVSYVLGLEGPAVVVDTACSSSLVAIHLAVQALRSGECSMALAGGATVMATPEAFVEFSRQRGLSADGRCRAFSDDADGTGWAEGVGVLVLERLSDAQRSGRRILGVIRGSAVNQDGASNGLTAPNGPSQQRVIQQALANAGLGTGDVDVVEAHGTGTTLGDPIEAQAIIATYGADRKSPLYLGSLKSNIGHAQAAAGVSGVIKMLLAMRHGVMPKTLHVDAPSSKIDWTAGSVELLTEPREWPVTDRPRRAGISSFGVSGTNAHVIVEEAPAAAESADAVVDGVVPLVLSGRSATALRAQAARLTEVSDLGGLAAGLLGRTSWEHRAVVLADSAEQAATALSALAAGRSTSGVVSGVAGSSGKTVFVFPGQGAQWVGMTRGLLVDDPVFAARMVECEQALASFVDWSLIDVVNGVSCAPGYDRVDVVQPASFAVMVSLAAVWEAHGVGPDAVVGHSQGEIAAACVAGALSLEDAARIVALRSRAIATWLTGKGGMMSVAAPVDRVAELVGARRAEVAAVNGPASTVVAGDLDALEEVRLECDAAGVRARVLPVDYASHTWQMELIQDELADVLQGVESVVPVVPWLSTVDGEWVTGPVESGYWYRNLRQRVEFAPAVERLAGEGFGVFVEVSSHPVLTSAVQDTAGAAVVAGTLRRDQDESASFLRSLAELHVRGVEVDWGRYVPAAGHVELPTYAFQRERYWLSTAAGTGDLSEVGQTATAHPLLGAVVETPGSGVVLTGRISLSAQPWLADHLISGSVVVPGAALVEMAIHAGDQVDCPVLDELVMEAPLRLAEQESVQLRVSVGEATADGRRPVTIHARRDDWIRHATGFLAAATTEGADLTQWPPVDARAVRLDEFYASLADRGYEYGPMFQGLTAVWVRDGEIFGEAELPEQADPAGFGIHPALLDAVLQGASAADRPDDDSAVEMPFAWTGVELRAGGARAVRFRLRTGTALQLTVADGTGLPVMTIGSIVMRPVAVEDQAERSGAGDLYGIDWEPFPVNLAAPADGWVVLPATEAERISELLLEDVRIAVVTNSAVAVAQDEVIDPAQAAVWAAVRAAQADTPERVVLIDADGELTLDLNALAEAGEWLAAVRGEEVRVPRIVRVAPSAGGPSPFAPEDTVLVAGARGAELARHLVDELGARRVVLVQGHGTGLTAVQDNEIDVVTCDLTDRAEVSALLAGIGPLAAVVHDAGSAAEVGHLDELTRGCGISSFVLTSSAGRFLGSGSSAVASRRKAVGDAAVSVVWGQTGPAWLGSALTSARAELIAESFDIGALRRRAEVPSLLRKLAGRGRRVARTSGDAGLLRRLAGLTEKDQLELVTELVRTEAAVVLGGADASLVRPDQAFKDAGFDSMTAVELRNRLTAATGVKLPATLVFDYPNATVLAEHLLRELLGGNAPALRTHAAVSSQEPIAVVGLGIRLPGGVTSPEELWDLLLRGGDVVGDFPADRGWDVEGLYDPDPDAPGKSYTRGGGFLDQASEFDAAFFGISPREALAMDPQQRLLLETTWEALERAGIDPASLRGRDIGVYTGLIHHDYGTTSGELPPGVEGLLMSGNAGSVAAGRVSYVLGVEGPAVMVDTACSSSLVAIHLASQALRSGECSMALAGGATVMAAPDGFIEFSRQRALAADGRCKAFSDSGDGFGMAEGVGVLVLERLSDARRNGRRILGVVRGSAVNQDGASNGLTAPNGPAQQRVIRQALANAGLSASEVDVVEAHGTGTALGDPIEAQALLATYGQDRETPLYLGSLKSNIGHAQAAAGVSGVIKMILAMRHGVMPKTLHVDTPSTKIDWTEGAVELLAEQRDWPEHGHPRRAGVSSFGVSGTNAHVIVEQAPETAAVPEPAVDGVLPVIVSARSAEALRAQAARLAETDVEVGGLAAGLLGRSLWEHRAVVLAGDRAEAVAGLTAVAEGRSQSGVVTGTTEDAPRSVVFAFTGQGAQRAGMGRELYEAYPVFAAKFDEVCEELDAALSGWVEHSVRDVVFGDQDGPLDQTVFAQSGLFAFEVALAALLESWGVRPDVVVGHSIGELSAAFVAGVWSLSDAARLVAARGRLMQALPSGGAMTAIAASEHEVTEALVAGVGIAAVNGPASVVVSGAAQGVEEVGALFAGRGRKVRSLAVSHAFHSHLMEPMLAEFAEVARSVEYAEPKIGIVSTMTGERSGWSTPEYWVEQIRRPVRYADAVEAIGEGAIWVEAGPDAVLTPMTMESAPALALSRRDQPEVRTLLAGLGELFTRGVAVDWSSLVPKRNAVELPTYAFQRNSYWLTGRKGAGDLTGVGLAPCAHPLLGAVVETPASGGVVLTGRLSVATHPWLADHVVGGAVVVPSTALVETAIHAGDQVNLPVLDSLTSDAPMCVTDAAGLRVQARVGEADATGRRPVSIYARPDAEGAEWTRYATGLLSAGATRAPRSDFVAWPPAGGAPVALDEFDQRCAERGYDYGAAFQCVTSAWIRGDEVFAEVVLPEPVDHSGFGAHPALLEAALQLGVHVGTADDRTITQPHEWSRVELAATGARELRLKLTKSATGFALETADPDGAPVLSAGSLTFDAVPLEQVAAGSRQDGMYRVDWVPVPPARRAEPTAGIAIRTAEELVELLPDAPDWLVLKAEPRQAGLAEVECVRHVLTEVLAVLRAVVEDPALAATRLVVSTAGGVVVGETDQVDPVAAAVWGLVRAAQAEHPDRFVLVDGAATSIDFDVLVDADEHQIAVRGDECYAPRLSRADEAVPHSATPFDPDGAVMITGGTGALGALTARHLVAEHGVRRLVLVSRRGSAAPGAAELHADLVELGAHVEIVACDLADRAQAAALLEGLTAPLTAVVHTAGVLDDCVLTALSPERLDTVLRPKVDAAVHLDELTRGRGLAAFVLFSSSSGVFSSAGQANYAAANTFLDALAERRSRAGEAAVSLAWGAWEAGMGGRLGHADLARMARSGMRALDATRGMALFDAGIQSVRANLVPVLIDVAAVRRNAGAGPVPSLLRALAGPGRRVAGRSAAHTGLLDRLLGLSGTEQTTVLLELVLQQAGEVLGGGADLVRPTQAFKDAGFDSLTAVELRNRLNGLTGVTLPATMVFDYPNPSLLAQQLRAELVGEAAAAPAAVAATAGSREPIAVVGVGLRLPGGVSAPDEFWEALLRGADLTGEFPVDRGWDVDGLYDPDPDAPGRCYTRRGGFLADVAEFDADFFGISPREALAMDPQQRLLLETTWEALERAGIDPTSLRGRDIGVFTGLSSNNYLGIADSHDELDGYLLTGTTSSVATGRVSYVLGVEGPAVTVDTACSSSLVAIHLASQALSSGECSMALAGGATVMATPGGFVEFSRQRGLAPDGRCKAFADAADGTGWGEGVGVLVLERFSDAQRNGRQILGVVRGSAVNQDGASNGLTAPNGPSQQRVIRQALVNAGLTTHDVDVVEAHGTGTTLGDPIEAQAVLATYGQDRETPLYLGSLKSNIGHAQAAAGVSGVIKMLLAMRHGVLPKTLHVDAPSTKVDWSMGRAELLLEQTDWPAGRGPRRAGVSAFGVSGTNAHVILEEAPTAPEAVETAVDGIVPLVLSARSAAALRSQAAGVADSEVPVHRLAAGLAGRSSWEHRAVVLAAEQEDARAGLLAVAEDRPAGSVVSGVADSSGKTVFVFPGQGAQWVGMARGLFADDPVFAARMVECEQALSSFVDWSLIGVVNGVSGAPGFDRVDVVQPASFAVMVSLAAVWEAHGVRPDAVVGHSQGEIAAACVAGALSLEDAARVVALRSKVIASGLAGRGGMMSVAAPVGVTAELIENELVEVAAVNGPASTVVAGDLAALEELRARCETAGLRARMVPVDYASHTWQVESVQRELADVLQGVESVAPVVPWLSTVDGEWVTGPVDSGYWYRNLRQQVQFERACARLSVEGFGVFVEVSSHPVLTSAVQDAVDEAVVIGTLRRDQDESASFLRSLAELHVRGVEVDWGRYVPAAGHVELPTYAFQRERYWPDAPRTVAGPADPVEASFWEAVERNDLSALATTLADGDNGAAEVLQPVLPMLASWRRRRQETAAVDSWRYRVAWHEVPLHAASPRGSWLVVLPKHLVGHDIAAATIDALSARGIRVVTVEITDVVRGELRDVLAGREVDGVLSLLALADERNPALSTLTLVQALSDAGSTAPLWCVTTSAVSTEPSDVVVNPRQASAWGLGLVAAVEHPALWGGLVDVPPCWDDQTADRLCAALASDEDQVAIRPAGTFGRRLVRAPISGSRLSDWRPGGTVLITGGTGALGARVARWLAGKGAEHLVLTSRRGSESPGAGEVADELMALGAKVTIASCDVGDRDSVAGLLDRLAAEGSPVRAVFHAAGVDRPARVLDVGPAEFADVHAGKVDGAYHLDELLPDELDAFVLFSSGAAVWGSAGQPAYAAANACLDALAHSRRARGHTALSIAWGAWGGGGMVHDEGMEYLNNRGMSAMAPELALTALSDALDRDETALTVADVDWARFVPAFTWERSSALFTELFVPDEPVEDEEPVAARQLAALPPEERERHLLDLVRTHAAAALGHTSTAALGPKRPFQEAGFDSLTAVELRNRLRAATGVVLPATLVFDHPTPLAVARHLDREIAGVQDDATLEATVLGRLDELERVLAGVHGLDDDARGRLCGRLEGIATNWLGARAVQPVEGGITDKIRGATDDDLLEFIRTEFGRDS